MCLGLGNGYIKKKTFEVIICVHSGFSQAYKCIDVQANDYWAALRIAQLRFKPPKYSIASVKEEV